MSLEEEIVETFISRINSLNDEERNQFRSAFDTFDKSVIITSAFTLTDRQKNILQKSISTLTEPDISINYQTDPQLVSGINIAVKNYKFGWNIKGYLDALNKHIISSLDNLNKVENVPG